MTPPPSSAAVSYTPVPDLLLGDFLLQGRAPGELSCLLRTLYLLYHVRGALKALSLSALLGDPVLQQLVAKVPGGAGLQEALEGVLRRATALGVLLRAVPPEEEETHYLISTGAHRELLARQGWTLPALAAGPSAAPGEDPEERANVFILYERHIGVLTPRIAEELKDAEGSYPESWLQDAFQEAARRGKPSWRYVTRILERWVREGRERGEPERHSPAGDPEAYLTSWGRRAGR